MIQKTLRLIALFLLIALVLSPIYSKHVRHYFVSLRIVEADLQNLRDEIPGAEKICSSIGRIKIPAHDNTIQVFHVMSVDCPACLEDLEIWSKFPDQLYKHLMINKRHPRVELINLIDGKSFERQDGKDMIKNLMKVSIDNEDLHTKLQSVNVGLCGGVMDNRVIEAIHIDLLPSTIILKNREVVYVFSGKMHQSDLSKVSGIVSSFTK